MARNLEAVFSMVGVDEKARKAIAAEYRRHGGTFARPDLRLMSEAIFAVEDELEHRARASGGMGPGIRAQLAVVADLNRRRNRILCQLGENEHRADAECTCGRAASEQAA